MTLSHNRYSDIFENGYDTLMTTGFWRLKTIKSPAISLEDIKNSNLKLGNKVKKAKLSKKLSHSNKNVIKEDKSTTLAANVLLDVKNLVHEKKETNQRSPLTKKLPSISTPINNTTSQNLFHTFNLSNHLNIKPIDHTQDNFKVEEKVLQLFWI